MVVGGVNSFKDAHARRAGSKSKADYSHAGYVRYAMYVVNGVPLAVGAEWPFIA